MSQVASTIEIYPPEVVSKIQALLDGGDREGALTTFMQDIVHVPAHEMAILRSAPNWSARVAAAHTLLRELRGSNEYVFEPTGFRDLRIPTLLLLGGDSPAYFKTAIEAVHAALPASQVRIMPGQQHAAIIQPLRYSRARWLSSSLKLANSWNARDSFLPAQESNLASSKGNIHRWVTISS